MVISMEYKRTFAGPAAWTYDVETEINEGKDVITFLQYNVFDGFEHFTTSHESLFRMLTDDSKSVDVEKLNSKFVDSYESIDDAMKSKFANCFKEMKDLVERLYALS